LPRGGAPDAAALAGLADQLERMLAAQRNDGGVVAPLSSDAVEAGPTAYRSHYRDVCSYTRGKE
jgi:hypothetical protein